MRLVLSSPPHSLLLSGRCALGRLVALLALLVGGAFAAGAPPVAPEGAPGAAPAAAPAAAPVAGALAGAEADRWFVLERLNAGLEPLDAPLDLRAPQSAVTTLVTLVREGDAARAAHALNLNLIPIDEQAAEGGRLARRLVWILDRQRLIAWDELTDRPDGAVAAEGAAEGAESGAPAARRSLLLGRLELGEREVELRLQRVRVGESEPRWLVSAGTVEWIDPLYRRYGPDAIDRWMPGWARSRPLLEVPLWEWGALLLLFGVALGLGRLVAYLVRRVGVRNDAPLLAAVAAPLGWLAAALLVFVATSVDLPFTGALLEIARPFVWVLLIAALTWLAVRAGGHLSSRFEERYLRRIERSDVAVDARVRRHRTALSVVRRAGVAAVLLVGLGLAISQFAEAGRRGATLLSSAGILSVVVGIAAQPVLGNLVAGLQLAATQPLRIGDSVYLHDTWGYVEELGYTFAVIRSWDERRLLIPLRRLVTEPYENWTLIDSHLIKPVYLHADPRVDVDAVRRRFAELLRDDPDYDGVKEPTLQVTATTEWTVVLRALCSAADPSAAWALHCRMREALVAYLADLEGGRYLPRQRVERGAGGSVGEGVEPPSTEAG